MIGTSNSSANNTSITHHRDSSCGQVCSVYPGLITRALDISNSNCSPAPFVSWVNCWALYVQMLVGLNLQR